MAGLTHTIGGVSFSALNSTGPRCSLGCYPEAMDYDTKRFHPAGPNGNYVVRCGRMGGKVMAAMLYVGTLATVHSNYQADRTAWENTALTIVDSTGTTFTRCNLDNGGMRITKKPIGFLRGGGCLFYAEAQFTVDS